MVLRYVCSNVYKNKIAKRNCSLLRLLSHASCKIFDNPYTGTETRVIGSNRPCFFQNNTSCDHSFVDLPAAVEEISRPKTGRHKASCFPQSISSVDRVLTFRRELVSCHRLQSAVRFLHTSSAMSKSKFEYVRQFETDDPCLPNCWLVVRIDGKGFHKFTEAHHYMKPNDDRGLGLMTRAAQVIMTEFRDIILSYGQSDEFSFIFHKNSKVYNRRASKIMTNVVSLFASSFTLFWPRFFNTQELQYPPSFDARVVLYPSDDNLKDYLSWRQADCHINNLYNTCFWKLVQEKGLSPNGAQERLKGTLSSDKNEILYSEFNTNYNNLPELYRKGTVIIRPRDAESANEIEGSVSNAQGASPQKTKSRSQKVEKVSSVVLHCDIIGKRFWEDHPEILGVKKPV